MKRGDVERKSWLDKIPIDAISIAVMLASMFLDGAYLRRYAYANWYGLACAYVLNSVMDVAVNKLTHEFVRHRLNARQGKRASNATWLLLVFAFGSFYYTTAFSWREASLQMPDEPAWLRGSLASAAPFVLAGLGAAEAMRAGRFKAAAKAETSEPKAERKPAHPFQCPHCSAAYPTQAALNGHQSAHKRERSNGRGGASEPEREVSG